MQAILFIIALASAVIAAPVAEPNDSVDISARTNKPFSVETFGSTDCGDFGQGTSNSGKAKNVCVEMGNAGSVKILNPDNCSQVSVDYFNGAKCSGNVAKNVNYDSFKQQCFAIPTDIGSHFSARITCTG